MQAVGPAPVLTHHSSKQEPLNFSRFGDVLNKVSYTYKILQCKGNVTLSAWMAWMKYYVFWECGDMTSNCIMRLYEIIIQTITGQSVFLTFCPWFCIISVEVWVWSSSFRANNSLFSNCHIFISIFGEIEKNSASRQRARYFWSVFLAR